MSTFDADKEMGFMLEEYLPLNHADFHILLALADDDRHGYAIMLHVEELTEGAVRLGPGTLYTSIKRLLASGLITETGDRPDEELDDQRRRYYRLSKLGGKVLSAETARMEKMLRHARSKRVARMA
jgi:DNA-binding PadR family transcriptional regulator